MDDTSRTRLHAAQQQFSAENTFLNTATHGLTPHRALRALERHTHEVATGQFSLAEADLGIERARAAYARMSGVPAGDVAIGTHVCQFVGTVAASLPPGSEVLLAHGEFTSVTFPLLARREHGVRVREVPLERLPEEVGSTTSLVAVSAVQSADGALAPLEDLVTACADHDARLLVDTTQSAGWLPLDASRIDYTVCATFKWLLGARGAAVLTGTPQSLAALEPLAANWYASEDWSTSLYGEPSHPSDRARRLDLPPVWSAWITLEETLALLEEVGIQTIGEHDAALGDRLRQAMDIEPTGSAIVSLPVAEGAVERVAEAGIATSVRDGRLRAAFHLYNDDADVDRLVEVLRG